MLVNNAAITPRQRQETPEGIELQFATNVLGYFWLTRAFAEQLKAGSPSRVANVASYWAGDLDLDDLEFRKRPYNNDTSYRQSKQAGYRKNKRYIHLKLKVPNCHSHPSFN